VQYGEAPTLSENQDPYAGLARLYDAENAGFVEDFPAYGLLAERFGGPVLEVGCGTGRVTFFLAGQGFPVTGVDPSAGMLSRARKRAAAEESARRITWLHAGAGDFEADGGPFHLAILPYGTLSHLTGQDEQIAALVRIARHLAPGGGLALDLSNPIPNLRADDVPALFVERFFDDPETGERVMQRSLTEVDRVTQIMTVTWVYDRLDAEGRVRRRVVPMRLRLILAAELHLMLAQAGFSGVELYGDYAFSPYEADSPRLFAVATRSTP
jgi:ubiquinone/menaquinone biosynthesis C-methylase UbiE